MSHEMTLSRIASGFLLVAASAAVASAQATPAAKPSSMMDHHASGSGWKELDAFHAIMAAAWHPVTKSGDLAPARQKADSLSASAKLWAAAKAPAACDTKAIRDAIADVVKGSERVASLVTAKATDADLKSALHDVHERFEVVEQGCHMPR
jgi:hypothetical protein